MAASLKDANPAGTGGDGRALAPNDNAKAQVEAEKVQLISFVTNISRLKREAAILKAPLDAKIGEITEHFRHAKAAGFLRKRVQAVLDDMGKDSRTLVEEEQIRRRYRDHMGLPNGESAMDLFGDSSPAEVKDAAHWRANGYLTAMRGEPATAPDNCAPRFVSDFMGGWHDGALVIAPKETVKPKPAPKPKAEKTAPEAAPSPENKAAAAGFSIHLLEPDGFEVERPDKTTFGDFPDQEAAWAAANADLAASTN